LNQIDPDVIDSDAYEVFSFLHFLIVFFEFISTVFIFLKFPNLSSLYYTHTQISAPTPLYPSRFVNALPIIFDIFKAIFISFFSISLYFHFKFLHTFFFIISYIIYFLLFFFFNFNFLATFCVLSRLVFG